MPLPLLFPAIQEIVSLGTHCQTAQLFKALGWKQRSYPFDWIFAQPSMVVDALRDDFGTFLDRTQYRSHAPNRSCAHASYGHMFNHHDPGSREDDWGYVQRCVQRFRNLLRDAPARKLFVTTMVNQAPGPLPVDVEDAFRAIVRELTARTDNVHFLLIHHVLHKHGEAALPPPHVAPLADLPNTHVLTFCTLHNSQGLNFVREADNVLLRACFKELVQRTPCARYADAETGAAGAADASLDHA